jgi:hypothetical protein
MRIETKFSRLHIKKENRDQGIFRRGRFSHNTNVDLHQHNLNRILHCKILFFLREFVLREEILLILSRRELRVCWCKSTWLIGK